MSTNPPGDGCLVATFGCIALIFLILAIYALILNSLVIAIAGFILIAVDLGWYFFVVKRYMRKTYVFKPKP